MLVLVLVLYLVLRVLIVVLKVLSDQVHLLLVLLQSMQYPRICGVVANQIAKAQTLAPMFDDLDKLGTLLPEILKHSTCNNLLADQVSQPATLNFLIRLQSNLLVRPLSHQILIAPCCVLSLILRNIRQSCVQLSRVVAFCDWLD